ncbi:MAG: SAM-dependent methyltransferase, partial [Clostridia bacterium]|nr:SAM-dependent methyltransferase [Clostridia bacterium]
MIMFEELRNYDNVIKVFASNPISKDCKFLRIKIQSVNGKNGIAFYATQFSDKQAFQSNLKPSDLYDWVANNIFGKYKQTLIVTSTQEITYLSNAKGTVKRLCRNVNNTQDVLQSYNRRKNYLLNEGDNIPVFEDLGIFTKERKVVNSMYDKFKQINRFVEILNDVFKGFDGQELTILDFGCGKSYLTFVIYYYFEQIKKVNATIIGYDIKADVVANCNKLAQKYGYERLQFVVADVSKDKLYDKKIDAVVSLHACDTATDYALHYAVKHDAKYVFSVPCCQHEINQTITNGGDLDILLKYGIVK